ncbi:putative type-1 angiotensin II receptor-associated protein-like [Apostichopus japonicus]|uniref:Putative type-1 angiotensin II receptor-associated protein-like n=1 Tax=Stichopus japonicus TaxID=307972 RepID=A0A2G8JX69_STIJA|nr:putative type-1 angiotensin II receptor-associated protein-like [Apostichopus japonicus]
MAKIIVVVQFVLTTWSLVGGFGAALLFMNSVLILTGLWTIGVPQSVDNIAMWAVFEGIAILSDIIILAVQYPPRGCGVSSCGAQRFAAIMCIFHLILKPFIIYFLVREYRRRGGDYSLNFPNSHPSGGYENLDQSVPTNSQVDPLPYNPRTLPLINLTPLSEWSTTSGALSVYRAQDKSVPANSQAGPPHRRVHPTINRNPLPTPPPIHSEYDSQ